jgi:Ser/Thr protein kinase RdoA (MazF antagonist)
MENLRSTLLIHENTEKYIALKDLAQDILGSYEKFSQKTILPEHIIHGDLKISNVIFDETNQKVVALIDLDTLMRSTIPIELGDALRSWCMSGGEDSDTVKFDREVYDTALEGYFSTALFLTLQEKNSIPYGMAFITLELSARFVVDAFNETYFRLDSSKYKTLFDQNKKRAENQFAFFTEISRNFDSIF